MSWLRLDLDGIIVQLKIERYERSNRDRWDEQWCKVSFSFCSDDWLHYAKDDDEVFLSCEIEELAENLQKLMRDEFAELVEMECIEPDFSFSFYPKKDLRNDPHYSYVREGFEIVDISMEWKVAFWHDGLTANWLTVTLDRSDMEHLLNYLLLVMGEKDESSPEIAQMIKDGQLY